MALLFFLMLVLSAVVPVAVDEFAPASNVPVEVVTSVSLTTALAAQLPDNTSGRCLNDSTTQVFLVPSGATNLAISSGPFCSTCNAGPTIPLAGRAWALSSGGPVSISCRTVDAGVGYAGGGGLSLGAVSASFLPLTGGTLAGPGRLTLPQVQGVADSLGVVDSLGIVDVVLQTAGASSSAGVLLQFVDARTTLAAATCDSISETGSLVLYDDGVSTSRSFCACEQHGAGVFGWFAIGGGDCTP